MTSFECKTFCPASRETITLTMENCPSRGGITTGTVISCKQLKCRFYASLSCLRGKRYGVASKQ
jgi:hypothetical protein